MKRRPLRGPAALLLLWLAAAVAAADVPQAFVDRHAARLERLFAQLDPAHPRTGPVRARWEAGQRREAATALADYFSTRPVPAALGHEPDWPDDLLERAEAALGRRFLLLGEWETVPQRADGGLDWRHRGRRADKERAWMLNRHEFLPLLAEAWRVSGDDRFRAQLDFLWQDWILANRYPRFLTFSPPWRPLEVARRILGPWIQVFHGSAALSDETRLLVLSSVPDHAHALRHHASFWGGNHLITEKLALLALAVAWPEFSAAADWRDHAVARVSAQLLAQSYPDGSYKELSNHYQRVVLSNAQLFLRLLAGVDPDYRDRPVFRRIEAMWDFYARVMKPDGTGPLNNASDLEQNALRVGWVWEFFDRPDWLHIATNGREGEPPEDPPSRLFPWAGQAILRNHWASDADWVYLDAGPYGSAHQHVDRLHVSAALGGRPLLVDNGRYTYRPGIWKDYFQGPDSHNLILLGGRPSQQAPRVVGRPLPVAFADGPDAAFAAAVSHFAHPRGSVPWTRAVLLDKRGFVLVLDHLVTFTDHALQAGWHFHPDVDGAEALRVIRLLYPQNGYTASVQTGSATPPLGGFHSTGYNVRHPSPVVRYTGVVGRPATLVWLLQRPDAEPMAARLLSEAGAPELRLVLERAGQPVAEARVRLHPQPELISYTAF